MRQWLGGRSQQWPEGAATVASCEESTADFAHIVSREHYSHPNRGSESRAACSHAQQPARRADGKLEHG